jgi:hypothetical protein
MKTFEKFRESKETRWFNFNLENQSQTLNPRKHFHRILALGKFEATYFRSQINGLRTVSKFVRFVSYPKIYENLGHKKFQDKITDLCKKFPIDVLLIDAPYGCYQFDKSTFSTIQKLGVKIFGMSFDNSTDFKFYIQQYSLLDGVICTAPMTRLGFDALGIPSAIFWPNAPYENFIENEVKKERDIEVSFVGNLKADRKQWIDYLAEKGIKVYVCGWGTQSGKINSNEYRSILQRSKITLNFNKQNHYKLLSIFDEQSQWRTLPTLRNIEATKEGALCLSEWVPELELMFPRNTIEYFSSKNELYNKILYYLNNDTIREARANKTKDHTLTNLNDGKGLGKCVELLYSKSAQNFSYRGKLTREKIDYSDAYKFGRIIFFTKMLIKSLRKLNISECFFCLAKIGKDCLSLNIKLLFIFIFFLRTNRLND